MTRFALVLLGLTSLVSAKPTFLVPLTYATPLTPGTQVSTKNGMLDGSEVAVARVDERTTGVANGGAARSAIETRLLRGRQSSSLVRDGASHPILTDTAPLGADGRVVDTPEVAAAKAAHAAAHVNERINLANEMARSGGDTLASSDVADGDRAQDTPEIATFNGRVDLANEAARSGDALAFTVSGGRVVPLVHGNGVFAALVPVGPDGRPLDVPEVAVGGDQSLARSIDALAVAGPALAYGRLVY